MKSCWWWMGFCLVCLLAACQREDSSKTVSRLPSDAYIWQHRWTPALADSVRASGHAFAHWRVLVGEWSPTGDWKTIEPTISELKQSKVPVIAVFRIDGRLQSLDHQVLLAQIQARWRALAAVGLPLVGIEIDYDCGEQSLAGYRDFLRSLKSRLPDGLKLSITALPAWLGANSLVSLSDVPDEMVLQVHAVQGPSKGLFDREMALAWAKQFDRITRKPFRLALPSYGSRIVFDAAGNIDGVESEATLLNQGSTAQEWMVKPAELHQFMQSLAQMPWQQLKGVVWFRLPTVKDRRAWQLTTLLAVVKGDPLLPEMTVSLKPGGEQGLWDVVLQNSGAVDAEWPATILLPGACADAEAVGHYQSTAGVDGFVFHRHNEGLLPPGQSRVIGWARCAGLHPQSPEGQPHVAS